MKKANNDFGARKYHGPEKGKDRTFHRVNSINARQSIYKNREEKLEKYKTNEKAVETKAQTVSAPQEKSDDISEMNGLDAFNISIGGDKGRQEYKVSANKSRQRRRKIGLRTNVVEKEEARRESEEMRRVGELVRRRLGEELRRIFREELEGKTENILEEKQDEGEEKERSRNQSRRKGEDELDQNSIETVRPLSSAGLLVAPQITIRKRLTLPLNNNNKMDEGHRVKTARQESDQTDGSRQQEAEARSDVDVEEKEEEAKEEEKEKEDEEEAERQKYFRMLWSLRQARVSARLRKGRNGAHQNRLMHQNVQKKHQRRYQQRGNGQKKQKYDTGARRRIGQNSLDGTEVS